LLAMSDPLDARSGLSNPLYASSLELARVERAGGEARVELRGYLELSGECEGRRILAQLRATALQFQGVDRASFTVDGEPLPSLLAQAAASAPTAAAGP
ncbi:MAG TPA: GerMN domain-containing protein, partial [Thermoanaerobaculia bacterium]